LDKHLHIVCLDTPYPVGYGGMFDLFYKLVALYNEGIKIHLHCYTNNKSEQTELNKYCEEVCYYERIKGMRSLSFTVPYIVTSRSDKSLSERLLKDGYPVLLEGIHCTWILNDKRFKGRKIILRLHNVESRYYYELFRHSRLFFHKLYYFFESRLLKKYEQRLAGEPSVILAVSAKDAKTYQNEFGAKSVQVLPVFTGFTDVMAKAGSGSYALYHANLSIAENEKAATWLLSSVFNDVSLPLIIAGRDPGKKLAAAVRAHPQAQLISNPTASAMHDLISNAQVNVLPSFNSTGIKLKLINALYNGRHCVVNEKAVAGSGLESLCHIANDPLAFKQVITDIGHSPLRNTEVNNRRQILKEIFDPEKNARTLIQLIW
jgi:hypothetical protein